MLIEEAQVDRPRLGELTGAEVDEPQQVERPDIAGGLPQHRADRRAGLYESTGLQVGAGEHELRWQAVVVGELAVQGVARRGQGKPRARRRIWWAARRGRG
jgi:hypothetical protein